MTVPGAPAEAVIDLDHLAEIAVSPRFRDLAGGRRPDRLSVPGRDVQGRMKGPLVGERVAPVPVSGADAAGGGQVERRRLGQILSQADTVAGDPELDLQHVEQIMQQVEGLGRRGLGHRPEGRRAAGAVQFRQSHHGLSNAGVDDGLIAQGLDHELQGGDAMGQIGGGRSVTLNLGLEQGIERAQAIVHGPARRREPFLRVEPRPVEPGGVPEPPERQDDQQGGHQPWSHAQGETVNDAGRTVGHDEGVAFDQHPPREIRILTRRG